MSVYRTIGPLVLVSQTDCGDIQLDNDLNYIEVEATTDNYDCLWRIEKPQGVLRYEVQYVDNGDQAECEKYQLLVRTNDLTIIEFPNITQSQSISKSNVLTLLSPFTIINNFSCIMVNHSQKCKYFDGLTSRNPYT